MRITDIIWKEAGFLALRDMARKEQKPVKQLASEILKQRLRAG